MSSRLNISANRSALEKACDSRDALTLGRNPYKRWHRIQHNYPDIEGWTVRWTRELDVELVEFVKQGKNWKEIKPHFPGRNPIARSP